jgi:sugar phosphate permease
MLLVRKTGNIKEPDEKSPLNDMADGLRYVWANPPVFGLILLSIVPFVFGMPLNTLLPAFNEDILGGGPDDLGMLMSSMGIGAILGSLMLASMGGLRNKALWLISTCVGWGIFTTAFGSAQVVWVAAVLVGAIGWLSAWNMSLNRGLLQMQVSDSMRGRIMSIDMMSHGLMPIGVIPISMIAERYSVAVALEVAGVVFVLVVLALAVFTSSVRRVDEDLPRPVEAGEG